MAHSADQVIVCSHYMRGHVADIYDLEEDRVAVIPNGIDPTELQPMNDLEALRRDFAQPDERLVLLVGRLVYEKGFQLALEALPGLIERVGDVRFLVAGSGTAEQELRSQATELGLDEHGTFMGWIGDDVLHSLYRIADLTVVPSIYEPFGLVALEAMASGCPCLVADTGGLREVVPTSRWGCASAPATRSRSARWRSACWPTTSCASGSWPRRRSTCSHSTGLTWGGRWPPCTRAWCPRASRRRHSQRICCGASRMRITRAGTPPTTALAGTSFVTTAFVPMTALSPTVTPRRMHAP